MLKEFKTQSVWNQNHISAQVAVFHSLYMIDKTRLQNMELRKIRDNTIALLKWSRS